MTEGVAEIGFDHRDGVTRLAQLYQRDPLRVLFPTPAAGDPPLAVIITTSGGLVAGDRLDILAKLGACATAQITTSAAEKVYRSTGRTTKVEQALSIGPDAALEYLPQETILFNHARLERKTVVELAPRAVFLGGEIVIFGRRARGERFVRGFFREVWELRRDGRIVWGDALHLDEDVGHIVEDPACFGGAAAFATMILAPAGSSDRSFLDTARAVLAAGATRSLQAGVTAIAGFVIARWLAADAALLRRSYTDLACHLRSAALGLPPRLSRVWHV